MGRSGRERLFPPERKSKDYQNRNDEEGQVDGNGQIVLREVELDEHGNDGCGDVRAVDDEKRAEFVDASQECEHEDEK